MSKMASNSIKNGSCIVTVQTTVCSPQEPILVGEKRTY